MVFLVKKGMKDTTIATEMQTSHDQRTCVSVIQEVLRRNFRFFKNKTISGFHFFQF